MYENLPIDDMEVQTADGKTAVISLTADFSVTSFSKGLTTQARTPVGAWPFLGRPAMTMAGSMSQQVEAHRQAAAEMVKSAIQCEFTTLSSQEIAKMGSAEKRQIGSSIAQEFLADAVFSTGRPFSVTKVAIGTVGLK